MTHSYAHSSRQSTDPRSAHWSSSEECESPKRSASTDMNSASWRRGGSLPASKDTISTTYDQSFLESVLLVLSEDISLHRSEEKSSRSAYLGMLVPALLEVAEHF